MKLPSTVVVDGNRKVNLHPTNDFVAQGGQAVIFRSAPHQLAKLYIDPVETDRRMEPVLNPAVMKTNDLEGKLQALTQFKDPRIIAPQGLVFTTQGQPIGYTMAEVPKPFALPVVFTNTFWRDNGWKGAEAVTLAEQMREVVTLVHSRKALLVDGNPLNWLAVHEAQKWLPRAIDVDAWQIGKWSANAFHAATRDYQHQGFTENSDWFAWGVVAFELLFGLHPYLGQLQGFKRGDLVARMQAQKSVFAPGVQLGMNVRDFGLCPPVMLNWFKDTFQGGQRSAPPSFTAAMPKPPQVAQVIRMVMTQGSGMLAYNLLFGETGDPARKLYPCGVVRLASGKLVDLSTRQTIGTALSPKAEIVQLATGWLLADWSADDRPVFQWLRAGERPAVLPLALRVTHFVCGGQTTAGHQRLFMATQNGLQELAARIIGPRVILAPGRLWPAFAGRSQWFEGCGLQQEFGRTLLQMPQGPMGFMTLPVPELNGYAPLNALARERYVTILAQHRAKGTYHRFELILAADRKSYVQRSEQVDQAELGAAFLGDGQVVTLPHDGELKVINPATGKITTFQDRPLSTAMQIAGWKQQVVYILDGKVWQLKLPAGSGK